MSRISSFLNYLQIIKQIPIFSKLNWFDLHKIARKSIIADHVKGDIICKVGSPSDFFYCLVSGRLQAYSIDSKGNKANVDFIHRGMYFGIVSVFTGKNHSLNFVAINDSVILKISKDDFQVILKSIPHLALEFSHTLSKRIRRKVKGTQSIFESKIISLYSPTKGTGSSTYAVNLALSLEKETGKRVIFLNLYTPKIVKNSSIIQESGKPGNQSSPKWKTSAVNLKDIVEDHEKIFQSIIKDDLSIDLLNVVFDPKDESLTKQISPFVSTLADDYHYVVVDLPNQMDDMVLETLTQSDLVQLITLDRTKDLELIRSVVDRLEVNLKENFNEEKIQVIIRPVEDKCYLSFEEINKFIDYKVHTMLPYIRQEELTVDVNSANLNFFRCDDKGLYSKVITKLTRQIGGVLVGLVLGGGAALGLAHIGVIRVLEEEHIPIDIVVGSSMGALIGSIWASGKNADELEEVAREFEKTRNMLKLFDPVIPISGFIGGRAIKRWLKKHLGNKTFYNTNIPLKIVAYDLIRREEIIISSGSLIEAVRKSIAIPGVIEPIKQNNQVIIDGGVLNPLPTNVLISQGIKKIIAVNVLQSPEDVSEGVDILERHCNEQEKIPFLKSPLKYLTFRLCKLVSKVLTPNISDIIVRTLQATEYVIAEQNAQQADITIHPDLIGINWFELNRVDDLIKSGEASARALLPEIKKLIEE